MSAGTPDLAATGLRRIFGRKRALTRREKRRVILGITAAVSGGFAIVAGCHSAGLWINTTDSMPMGLWRQAADQAARPGDVVLLCLPKTPATELGHRTGTHSFLALAFCTLAVLIAEAAGYANIGYGFLVGYVAHIGADLLTIEGCALLYPWDRARYAFWPAVQTGSLGEAVILLPILGLILGIAYWLNPSFFDAARQIRLHVPFLFHVPVT